MSNMQSILPNFDVFTAAAITRPPRGMITEAAAGTGLTGLGKSRLFALSPVVAAMKGLGDDASSAPSVSPPAVSVTGGDVIWTVAILGVAGALCYQAGKAIAPSRQDAPTWGWIGVPVGLFTGVLGLGIMGVVANHRKG